MNPTTFPYGTKITVEGSVEAVYPRVVDALKDEGFGILTEIDVRETLKKKLDVEFRSYRILGACNPPLAHRALGADIDIGLLLPCNVVLYEADEPGQTVVAAIDPMAQLGVTERADIEPVAREVGDRLGRVLAHL